MRRFLGIAFLSFAVVPSPAQSVVYTTLYNFSGPPDGAYPYAGVMRDAEGNLSSRMRNGIRNQRALRR